MDNSGLKVPGKQSTHSSVQRADVLHEKQVSKEPMVPWYPGGRCCRRRTNAVTPLGSSRKCASRIPTLPAFNKKCISDSSGVPPRLCVPLECATPKVTRVPSRLPVPKKPTRLAPLLNSNVKNTPAENNLSAAARRQKFHQSRHPGKSDVANKVPELPVTFHVTGPSEVNCNSVKPPRITTAEISNFTQNLTSGFLQGRKDKTLPRFQNNIQITAVLPAVIQKQVLPPVSVKPGVSPNSKVESQQSKKKKNLLGEFTHFPAVCNIIPSKTTKILSITTVPSLPPILPPPPAPPPSISASLEQETSSKNIPGESKMESLNNSDSAADGESGMMVSDSTPSSENEMTSAALASERRRAPFVHTISIVVEPVDIEISDSENGTTTNVDMDNIAMKSDASENIVKTVMDLARLRKEEFARLLEEHAQIVREIKRAETMKM